MDLVIFDCDGVLVESEAIHIAVEMAMFEQVGLIYERADYIKRFMGLSPDAWYQQIGEALARQTGKPPDPDLFERIDTFAVQKLREELVSVTGARATIQSLETAKCVASSSSPDGIRWKLAHTDLIDLFEPHLFSTQLVENGKPAPDLFLLAADRMDVAPSQCVVVEDSSNGVMAGKRAGMKVVGFTAGSHCPDDHGDTLLEDGADVIADAYHTLPDTIDRLSRG